MPALIRLFVVLVVLSLVGWLRMPFEQKLSEELTEAHLLSPSFDKASRASLSQKGFVASFGSLRPTLAAVSALSATRYHGESDWDKLEESMETTVLLDPYNPYYWDLAAWHLGVNASTSSLENTKLAPIKAKKLFKEYIFKGDSFYARGIEMNPRGLDLRVSRARLWSNSHKILDYPKVAEILQAALSECELSEGQRERVRSDLFYTLLRIPGRVNEAYMLGRELYESSTGNHYPSLLNGLCALQMHPRVKVQTPLTVSQLYGSKKAALKHLANYMRDGDEYKPRYGMRALFERLSDVNY